MSSSNIQLTHDEIWDDSALIDSWNEALDEYKVSETSHLPLAIYLYGPCMYTALRS